MNQNKKDETMKLFVFLSDLLGRKVVDVNGRVAGRLHDLPMHIGDEVYPRAQGLVVRRGFWRREYVHIPEQDILSVNDVFHLKTDISSLPFQKERLRYDFSLRDDVLDRQVVDTDHQKVVRVNDIHLLRIETHFYLAHVDVGIRALVRRLGWAWFVDGIMGRLFPRSPYLQREDFIPWRNTQILASGRYKNVLRLDVSRQKLSTIPPIELTEIMEDLDIFEKLHLFKSLDEPVQRKVFSDLATQEKNDLIDQMEDREAVSLLENIPADEATDLLLSLPKGRTAKLLRMIESKTARKLRKLLGFAKDSAGGLMTTEYLSLPREAKVADALQLIRDHVNYPGNLYHLYVVDDQNRLLGATSVRQFINAAPERPLLETCYPRKIFVRVGDGMEEIALLLEKYKYSSVPVLSDDDVLQGVITIDDVLEELISLIWSKYKEKLV